jgi:hypothetical protein
MRLSLAIALVLACGWGWTAYAHAQNEHALARVAGELAGRPVHVDCQGFFGELFDISPNLGDVRFENGRPADRTHMVRSVCEHLHDFRTSSSHPEIACLTAIDWSRRSFNLAWYDPCAKRARRTAEAINTLTHEAMHMRGWTGEATAQCYAIQLDAWTVERLGGTADEGRAVAAFLLALQPGMADD